MSFLPCSISIVCVCFSISDGWFSFPVTRCPLTPLLTETTYPLHWSSKGPCDEPLLCLDFYRRIKATFEKKKNI